jgi:hypothetical protein
MPRGSKHSRNAAPTGQQNLFGNFFSVFNQRGTPKPEARQPSPEEAHGTFPGWETLTEEQQQTLLDILTEVERLKEKAAEIADSYEEELLRQQQQAAQGAMLAQRDGAGLNRVPVPPVPDPTREKSYEKFALDSYRLGIGLDYLDAMLAYLIARGYDRGYDLFAYLAARTDMLAEGRVKTAARVLEETGRLAYTQQYSRTVNTFSKLGMQRLHHWDEQSRQQDSWVDKLRRLLAGE